MKGDVRRNDQLSSEERFRYTQKRDFSRISREADLLKGFSTLLGKEKSQTCWTWAWTLDNGTRDLIMCSGEERGREGKK